MCVCLCMDAYIKKKPKTVGWRFKSQYSITNLNGTQSWVSKQSPKLWQFYNLHKMHLITQCVFSPYSSSFKGNKSAELCFTVHTLTLSLNVCMYAHKIQVSGYVMCKAILQNSEHSSIVHYSIASSCKNILVYKDQSGGLYFSFTLTTCHVWHFQKEVVHRLVIYADTTGQNECQLEMLRCVYINNKMMGWVIYLGGSTQQHRNSESKYKVREHCWRYIEYTWLVLHEIL